MHEPNEPESPAARRLQDLRRAQPADSSLQNLLQLLSSKLELCGRLPIYEYEAESEGAVACARAFRELAERERESFAELLDCLRQHLDYTARQQAARRAMERAS